MESQATAEEEAETQEKKMRSPLDILRHLKMNLENGTMDADNFFWQMGQQHELTPTKCVPGDTAWDSLFTSILQNVYFLFRALDLDEILEAGVMTPKDVTLLEIKLNQLRRKGRTTLAADIVHCLKNLSCDDPLVSEQLDDFIVFLKTRLRVDINIHFFDWQTTSIHSYYCDGEPQETSGSEKMTSTDVVIKWNDNLGAFQSLIHRRQLSHTIEDYCSDIFGQFAQDQEMVPYFESIFADIETQDIDNWIEDKLKNLKQIENPNFQSFHEKLLPEYDGVVQNSSLLLLEKYESQCSPRVIQDLIRQAKTHLVYALQTASLSVIKGRVAGYREKVSVVMEQVAESQVENDRLEHVIRKSEAQKINKEKEIQSLQENLDNCGAQREKLEGIIEDRKIELERVAESIQKNMENVSWIKFKKELIGMRIPIEILKKSDQILREVNTQKGSLTTLVNTISKIFSDQVLGNPHDKKNVVDFASRIENDGEENRRAIIDILETVLGPPNIGPKIGRSDIIQVTGRQVMASQVIEKVIATYPNFSELRILAGDILYLDASFKNEKFHGKNVVLVASVIDVQCPLTINTSGRHGVPRKVPSKAENGGRQGRSGTDGQDGTAGENAGHVYLLSETMKGSEHLEIYANGGNGGHGQSGGDGSDGKAGEDGKNGSVTVPGFWDGLSKEISWGTPGRVGEQGGNGGRAGLGGQKGHKGQIKIVGTPAQAPCTIKNEDGEEGKNGVAGKGGAGGTGGKNGADHGYAWHNYMVAGGYFIEERGKLELRQQQSIWYYFHNGWDLIVEKTESEVQQTRGVNGVRGQDGTMAMGRAHEQKTSGAKENISEGEILQTSKSIRSQFGHAELSRAGVAGKELESQQKALMNEQKGLAHDLQDVQSQHQSVQEDIELGQKSLKQTQQEKSELSQLIRQSGQEQEAVQMKLEKLNMEKMELAQSLQIVQCADETEQNISTVIDQHLQEEQNIQIAAQMESQQMTQVMAEFDPTKCQPSPSYPHVDEDEEEHEAQAEDPLWLQQQQQQQGQFSTLKSMDFLSDEEFVTAIIYETRVKNSELAVALKIGLESVKTSKIPRFVRQLLFDHTIEESKRGSSFLLTPQYVQEKLATDIKIVNLTQNWAEGIQGRKVLEKIFKLISHVPNPPKNFRGQDKQGKDEDDNSTTSETRVGQFILAFRHFPFTPKNVDKIKTEIDRLQQTFLSPSSDSPPELLLAHLDNILVEHMESWFMEECKIFFARQKNCEEALRKVHILLDRVNKIYLDLESNSVEISLFDTYNIFLNRVKDPKFLEQGEQDLFWQRFILELTGFGGGGGGGGGKNEKMAAASQLMLDQFGKIETRLIDLQKSVLASKSRNQEIDSIKKVLDILLYLIPYVTDMTPGSSQKLKDGCQTLSVYVWTGDDIILQKLERIKLALEENFLVTHQRDKMDRVLGSLQKISCPDMRQSLIEMFEDLVTIMTSPHSLTKFEERLSYLQTLLGLLGEGKVDLNLVRSTMNKIEGAILSAGGPKFFFKNDSQNESLTKMIAPCLQTLGQVSQFRRESRNLKYFKREDSKTVIDILATFHRLNLRLLHAELKAVAPAPAPPSATTDPGQDLTAMTTLCQQIVHFNSSLEFNCVVKSAIHKFQLNLQPTWRTHLNTQFDCLKKDKLAILEKWDAGIRQIMEYGQKILSPEFLFRGEILGYIKTHLFILMDGLTTQTQKYENTVEILDQILDEVRTQMKNSGPKDFFRIVATTVNTKLSLLSFKLSPMTTKEEDPSISKFNETMTFKDFLGVISTNLDRTGDTSGDQSQTFWTRVHFVASHWGRMNDKIFDPSTSNNVGDDEKLSRPQLDQVSAKIDHIVQQARIGQAREEKNRRETVQLMQLLEDLKGLLTAVNQQNFVFALNFLMESRTRAENSFLKKLSLVRKSCQQNLDDLFQIYAKNPTTLPTPAGPIIFFMDKVTQEIFPKLESMTLESLQKPLDNIYLDSMKKYFSVHSIPSMPTVLRAKVIHFGTPGGPDVADIFGQFGQLVGDQGKSQGGGKDKKLSLDNGGWELPFLSIYIHFLKMVPDHWVKCAEISELSTMVQELRLEYSTSIQLQRSNNKSRIDGGHPDGAFVEEILSKLDHVLWALMNLSSLHLRGQVRNPRISMLVRRWEQSSQLICSSIVESIVMTCEVHNQVEMFLEDNVSQMNQAVESELTPRILKMFQNKFDLVLSRLVTTKKNIQNDPPPPINIADTLPCLQSLYNILTSRELKETTETVTSNWTILLAVVILQLELNEAELEFLDRIFHSSKQIQWNPTEEQKILVKKMIHSWTTQEDQTSKVDDGAWGVNRLTKIFATDVQIENEQIMVPYFLPLEQFYVSKLMQLTPSPDHPTILKSVQKILIGDLPSSWLFQFRELTINTLFRRLVSLHVHEEDEVFKNVCQQDTILSRRFKDELQEYRASRFESTLNTENLEYLAANLDGTFPSGQSGLTAVVRRMIDFKHYFNRHFVLAQGINGTTHLSSTNTWPPFDKELIHWLDVLYKRCSAHKGQLSFHQFNDLFYRSVDLSYKELIKLTSEGASEGWVAFIFIKILMKHYSSFEESQFTNKKRQTNSGGPVQEKYLSFGSVKECFQTYASNHQTGNPLMTKLLITLGDKLAQEVQFASDHVGLEMSSVHGIVRKMSSPQLTVTPELLRDLKDQPLAGWSRKFREHDLLKKYTRQMTESVLKFENKFGDALVSKFLKVVDAPVFLSDGTTDQISMLQSCLDNFNTGQWQLDENLLTKLDLDHDGQGKNLTCQNFLDTCSNFAQESKKTRKRDVPELVRLLREDPKNETILTEYLDVPKKEEKARKKRAAPSFLNEEKKENDAKIVQLLARVQEAAGQPSMFLKETQKAGLKPVDFDRSDILLWKNTIDKIDDMATKKTQIQDNMAEILAVISRGLYLEKGYGPRDTQMISAIILLDQAVQQKGCLAEVSTGEGKTFIVAILVLVRSLYGDDVDVITSSPVLAQENLSEVTSLYKMFDVTAAVNCDVECEKDEEARKKRYKSQVIYGDVASFQRDLLLTTFFNKDVTQNRTAEIVLVDEVDSMLLDKGENVLYLSHAIPDLKFLWPLFIEIWQAVHAPDVAMGRNRDIFVVARFIKEKIRLGLLLFPNSLQSFIDQRLNVWIQNAFLAKSMSENDPYIITDVANKGPTVVIVDKDTGVEQESMSWSNGLHQFIQLKHTDKLSSESLKAVFTSNISYFRSFAGRLFGITGTLGSKAERELIAKCYQVDFFSIPRFMVRNCFEEPGLSLGSKSEWLSKIKENVHLMCETRKRAVLIICENVDTVNVIADHLRPHHSTNVYTYKNSGDADFTRLKKNCPKLTTGCVIVATNIAGRGTDFKISPALTDAGGLHVILSYLPANVRVEEQAFGRTARAGNNGTVQYIVLAPDYHGDGENDVHTVSVDEMRRRRDEGESQKLDDFRLKNIPRIEIEEKLCQRFKDLLKKIVEDQLQNMEKGLRDLHVENLKNRWALWLDSMSERIKLVHVTKEEPIFEAFNGFRDEMMTTLTAAQSEATNGPVDSDQQKKRTMFEKGPTEMTKLGKYYEQQKDFQVAQHHFETAIAREPNHSEVAHYYLASCVLQKCGYGLVPKSQAVSHLKAAEKLLRKRIQLLLATSETLKVTDRMRRNAGKGSRSNRYENQVRNEIELLQVHIGKIGDAVGVVVDAQFLKGLPGVLDQQEAEDILQVLLCRGGIFKNYRISKKVTFEPKSTSGSGPPVMVGLTEGFNIFPHKVEWPATFGYCREEVTKFIKEKAASSDKKERVMLDSAFTSFVQSQETFWTVLKNCSLIVDEVQSDVEIIHAEKKEVFDSIVFPQDLIDYKSRAITLLTESNLEPYSRQIFEDFGLSKDKLEEIEALLRRSKIIKSTHVVQASLSDDMVQSTLRWNKSLKKWEGLPDSLKTWQELVEAIIEDGETTEGEDIGPRLKKKICRHDIPLPATRMEASKQLWNFLRTCGAIKSIKMDFPLSEAESGSKIDAKLADIEKSLKASSKELEVVFEKYHGTSGGDKNKKDENDKSTWPTTDAIFKQLKTAAGKIRTIPNIKVDYQELKEYFKTGDYPPEIQDFENVKFSQVLECTEKKGWFNWHILVVALIGIAQIVAGVLINVLTVGAATYFGTAFISEGIGDIIYAIQAQITGSFTLQEYGIQKAISMAVSIATAGVGAWVHKTAVASAMGVKIAFQTVKAVGMKVIKDAGQRFVTMLANLGFEKLLDYIKSEIIRKCKDFLGRAIVGDQKTSQKMAELVQVMDEIHANSYENGQAEKVIRESFASVLLDVGGGSIGDQVAKYGFSVAASVASEIGNVSGQFAEHARKVGEKMNLPGATGFLQLAAVWKKVAKLVDLVVVKGGKALKGIVDMVKYIPQLLGTLIKKLKTVAINLKTRCEQIGRPAQKSEAQEFAKFQSNFTVTVRDDVVTYFMNQIQTAFVQPALQYAVQKGVKWARKYVSQQSKSIMSSRAQRGQMPRTEEEQTNILQYFKQQKHSVSSRNKKRNELKSVELSELDPGARLKNNPAVSVQDAISCFGNSAKFYRDKKGDIVFEKMPFEQSVKGMGQGKTSGYFDLLAAANYHGRSIKIQDTTGELKGAQSDGMIEIKPIKGLLGFLTTSKKANKGPALELIYTKDENGQGQFQPKLANGQSLELPSNDPSIKNIGLFQCLDFHVKIEGKGDDQMESVMAEIFDPTNFNNTLKNVQNYTLASKRARYLYNRGVVGWATNFGGAPGSPSLRPAPPSNLTPEDVQRLQFSQTMTLSEDDNPSTDHVSRRMSLPSGVTDRGILTRNLLEDGADDQRTGGQNNNLNSVSPENQVNRRPLRTTSFDGYLDQTRFRKGEMRIRENLRKQELWLSARHQGALTITENPAWAAIMGDKRWTGSTEDDERQQASTSTAITRGFGIADDSSDDPDQSYSAESDVSDYQISNINPQNLQDNCGLVTVTSLHRQQDVNVMGGVVGTTQVPQNGVTIPKIIEMYDTARPMESLSPYPAQSRDDITNYCLKTLDIRRQVDMGLLYVVPGGTGHYVTVRARKITETKVTFTTTDFQKPPGSPYRSYKGLPKSQNAAPMLSNTKECKYVLLDPGSSRHVDIPDRYMPSVPSHEDNFLAGILQNLNWNE